MPQIRGKFDCDRERWQSVTYGMNAKGGVDEADFVAYIINYILPIYPNSRGVPFKRILINMDSRPGQFNIYILVKLRANGLILYPGVPNSTGITQETDRNYGPFKAAFCQVLDRVFQQYITKKVSVSLLPTLVSLIVFGGIYPKTS